MADDVRTLVQRYLRASIERDAAALRSCLADEIRFDWGVVMYTDPEDFVAAVAGGEVEWREWTELAAVYDDDSAAVFYEGVNAAADVRLRAAEHLVIESEAIVASVVVFSQVPLQT